MVAVEIETRSCYEKDDKRLLKRGAKRSATVKANNSTVSVETKKVANTIEVPLKINQALHDEKNNTSGILGAQHEAIKMAKTLVDIETEMFGKVASTAPNQSANLCVLKQLEMIEVGAQERKATQVIKALLGMDQ